jgi:hypothetical protein
MCEVMSILPRTDPGSSAQPGVKMVRLADNAELSYRNYSIIFLKPDIGAERNFDVLDVQEYRVH